MQGKYIVVFEESSTNFTRAVIVDISIWFWITSVTYQSHRCTLQKDQGTVLSKVVLVFYKIFVLLKIFEISIKQGLQYYVFLDVGILLFVFHLAMVNLVSRVFL